MFEQSLSFLKNIATSISLELFVIVGSFLEEIIAPIPSPFVMTTASVIAKEQAYTMLGLGIVVVLGAMAKTASTFLVYLAVDKAEDVVMTRFGKYVGISHEQLEKIGKVLSGSWWDDILLFIARALPFIPTFPISVAAGMIRYDVRSYLVTTFLGSVVRNVFYLWVGYFGYAQFERVWSVVRENPLMIGGSVLVLIIAVVATMKVKNQLYDSLLHHGIKRAKKEAEK